MKLLSYIKYPILLIITSFFFFPFEFVFLQGINTKMVLAAMGLVWCIVQIAMERKASIDKDFFISVIFASLVSIAGFVSVVYNSTTDLTYASYIVSFFVWMGGAFFVVSSIALLHGRVTPLYVINYLIATCVAQCIIALLIDGIPSVKGFVDSFLAGTGFMGKMENRLYGIGCALDVAGQKFSCVLVAIPFVVLNRKQVSKLQVMAYWTSYMIVAVAGNMIARTTTVGLVLSLLYICSFCVLPCFRSMQRNKRILQLLSIIVIALPIILYSFNHNINTNKNLRFAFEGFFSLVETGKWETHSNNRLAEMLIIPDNVKTWVIGDGYFNNPNADPNFIGDNPTEYYKGTDIGYLRFIFYFGIVGLLLFALFFYVAFSLCSRRHPNYAILFLMLLTINYVVWVTVSSDIFLIFALFLCVPYGSEEDVEHNVIE